MPEEVRPWYRKTGSVLGAIFGAVVVFWAIYFLWQVGHSFSLIRGGQDPLEVAKQKQFQASLVKTVATANVTADDLKRIESADAPSIGDPKAKIHIVEFVDYQCPYSREVANTIRAFMKTHQQDAYLTVRDFPITELHPDAEQSSIAARCVYAQGNANRFWTYYDRLFASQEAQSASDLRLYAQQIGVDMAAFDSCVSAKTPLDGIHQSLRDGIAAGVQGTPTFFFNGVKIQGAADAQSIETVFAEIQRRTGTN